MSAIGVGTLLVFFGLIGTVLWVVALVDALRRPTNEWETARQNQIVWVGVIVLANAIGAIIYWLVARPKLNSAKSA